MYNVSKKTLPDILQTVYTKDMIDTEIQKKNLQVEKDMLIAELSGLGILNTKTDVFTPTPENRDVSDEEAQADIFEAFQVHASTGEILQERLMDVDSALEKIKMSLYGTCESCNGKIEEDRLMINPAAKTCKTHMNQ